MHGRIRTTPGEHLQADACWEGGEYRLRVAGEMREAALFGENMVLRREISSTYGEKTITVTDQIENESYREEPLMILYHINMGYPFLDENTRLYIPTRSVTARDKDGEGHEGEYDRMDPPRDNEPEYVFIHDLKTDGEGNTQILVVNEPLGLDCGFPTIPGTSLLYGVEIHRLRGLCNRSGAFQLQRIRKTLS